MFTASCSFAFVHGPPKELSKTEAPDCTQFPLVPIFDALVAAGGGAMIYSGATAKEDPDPLPGNPGPAVLPRIAIISGVIIGGTALASAIYGFVQVSRCVKAHNAFTAQFAQPN
jgi:hypothetical protein